MSENDEERFHSDDHDKDPAERPRRRDDYEKDYDRGERPRRRDDDDRDYDDRPRRIRRSGGDSTGGLIPYNNPMALASYYCGVFGLISCFLLLGIFGVLPIFFGIRAWKHAKLYPETGGKAHAIVGIILGSLELLTFLVQIGVIITLIASRK